MAGFSVARAAVLAVLVLYCSGAVGVVMAQPTVTYATPGAVLPGGCTRLVLHGDKIAAPLRVWSPSKVAIRVVSVDAKQATLDIIPEGELPLGPLVLFLATEDGPSAPVRLLVDDLPSLEERADNHAPETAQTLGGATAIDAAGDGKQADYFRFRADQGAELTFEVLAEQIGSAFDPVVRLLAEDGRELASFDDQALSPDCRFRHRFEKSGTYLLEVHDNRYVAGGRYRLRMGQLPLVSFAYPPVIQRGTCVGLNFAGIDRERMPERRIQAPRDAAQTEIVIAGEFKAGGSAGWTGVRLDDHRQLSETEPNDTQAQANALDDETLGLTGLLERAGDRDVYRLQAKQAQVCRFSATSRSFGSASLVKMTLRDAAGKTVGKTTVGDSDEWHFDVKFPADGDYFLEIEDLMSRGGPEHGYHVSLGPVPPFELSLKPDAKTRDRFALEPEVGAAALDVVVKRETYSGPIALELEPPTSGLTILNPTIAAGAKEARVILRAQSDWQLDCIAPVRLVARATADAADAAELENYRTSLSTAALLVQRSPHVPYPPECLDGLVMVVGVPRGEALFEVTPGEAPLKISPSAAESTLTLAVKRLKKEFKDSPVLIDSQLPKLWSASAKADKDKLIVTLKHPEGAAKEPAELKFFWYGELSGRGQTAGTRLPVEFVDPGNQTDQTPHSP